MKSMGALGAAVVLSVLGLLFYFGTKDDIRREQSQQGWVLFSKQNHCRVVEKPGFWDPNTTWQCDGGFQVRR